MVYKNCHVRLTWLFLRKFGPKHRLQLLRVARVIFLTILSPGASAVFVIIHSSAVRTTTQHFFAKQHYWASKALTSDRLDLSV
ncbi:MAG: hypothetical protein ACJA1F_003297 [Paracoccaceae bacterium]|jgi:hypothetical protein